MSASSFKKLEPEEYLRQHYQQGLRPDGRRGLNSLRPVSISVGSITVADGSAVVKQGDTIVVRNFPEILVYLLSRTPISNSFKFYAWVCLKNLSTKF